VTPAEAIELRRIVMPLITAFRTATGTHATIEKLLVRWITADAEGWGECPVGLGPGSVPTTDDAWGLLAGAVDPEPPPLPPPAAAALETARLDAELRAAGMSLASHLGATRTAVEAGVVVGITASRSELLEEVDQRRAEGYRRVKLKIEPGWDVEPVAAVRERFGPDLALQVDANGAYRLDDAPRLVELDRFGLLMIEQPLAFDDLEGHARLARQIETPVCLDESIGSLADVERALELGACSIVNVKPARLGGIGAARAVHDYCRARDVPVWCGGMLETGVGRAVNVALTALPGFTLPGDLSASDRYYAVDVTAPFTLVDGRLRVPDGPGIGVEVLPDVIADVTIAVETVRARA
jgi:O-succinylbenzoate synthase